MVTKALTDLFSERNALELAVNQKINANQFCDLNSNIEKDLKIFSNVFEPILNSIEARIRRCEEIYYTYFDLIDYSFIGGMTIPSNKKLEMQFEYNNSSLVKKVIIDVNDSEIYKEIIDNNFQSFILSMATLGENIVRLCELILKKIIIYSGKNKPQSTQLSLLIVFIEMLESLGYRISDDFHNCLRSYTSFFEKFLEPINLLRNRFIHGHSTCLYFDGSVYKINDSGVEGKLGRNSPQLEVQAFSESVLNGMIDFIKDLFTCLESAVSNSSGDLPI